MIGNAFRPATALMGRLSYARKFAGTAEELERLVRQFKLAA